jgi:hypothetical protein
VGLRVGGERRAPSGNRVREWGIFWARAGERRGRLGGKLRRCFFFLENNGWAWAGVCVGFNGEFGSKTCRYIFGRGPTTSVGLD